MIKICPECLNISIDEDSCKFCGFPFSKKIIGRLDDYYFYDIIELVNNEQISEAKINLEDKKTHLTENKHLLLSEKISIVEELLKKADKFAKTAMDFFQSNNLDSAATQIDSALAIYKHPRFLEIQLQIDTAKKKKNQLITAEAKYQEALIALKNVETVHGLQLLKESITLDSQNVLFRNKYEDEVSKYLQKSVQTIRDHFASKNISAAKLILQDVAPFAGTSKDIQELQWEIELFANKSRRKKQIVIVLAIIAILFVGILITFQFVQSNNQRAKWQAILAEDNIRAYETYIAENPNSKFLQEANANLQALVTKDSSLWQRANETSLQYDYKKYIDNMERSGGKHIEAAKDRIDSIVWASISPNADVIEYENYLNEFPYGRYAMQARSKISLEPSEFEKTEILEYITAYFTAYQNRDLETVMMYYNPITPTFGTRRNLTKADLRQILENDLKTVSTSSFKIDPSSYEIKKNEQGSSFISFNSDSYISRIKTEIVDGSETESSATYYTNAQWFFTLDANRKIISYKLKIISEQQINQ